MVLVVIAFRSALGALVGGAAVGAGAVFAAPVVVAGLGFGASGIAAGSTAAWMMSTYGGYVATGSAVAVAQSIGAAGMGAVANCVAAAAGGTAGALAGAKLEKKFRNTQQKTKIP